MYCSLNKIHNKLNIVSLYSIVYNTGFVLCIGFWIWVVMFHNEIPVKKAVKYVSSVYVLV